MGKKAFLPARVLAAAGLSVPPTSPASRPRRSGRSTPPIAGRGLAPGTVVLGLDPGTILVGYGVVEVGSRAPRFVDAGVVRTHRRAPVPERLGQIQREVALLLDRFRPSVVVVERAFAARNVLSALRIGEGRGVILACAASFGAEVVEMPPASAKKAVVGHGGASKVQVARMAAAALGLREAPRPLDASDALALALAHVGTELTRFRVAIDGLRRPNASRDRPLGLPHRREGPSGPSLPRVEDASAWRDRRSGVRRVRATTRKPVSSHAG